MRNLFFLICLLSSLCAMAQKTIVMEQEGGVYKIPCKVNGAKMKMIFDTGASSVSISLSIAEYLYENDYITKDDIIGTGKAQVADGRIVDKLIINLRDIEVAGIHVKNVKAAVSESLTAPLLFGQSAIQKLGKISLHGNRLTIENAYNPNASDKKCDELVDKANKYFDQDNYYMAVRNLLELEEIVGLGDYGYYMLCRSYYKLKEYQNCYDAAIRFEQNCKEDIDSNNAGDLYKTVAYALLACESYIEAIKWCKKAIGTLSLYNNTEEDIAFLYSNIGANQASIGEYFEAILSYKKAIELRCKFLHIANEDFKLGDDDLALFYYCYALALQDYHKDQHYPDAIKFLRKAVVCGSDDAKNYLKELGY